MPNLSLKFKFRTSQNILYIFDFVQTLSMSDFIIFTEGDFVVFERGRYFGQVWVVELCTPRQVKIRIAPHCTNGLSLVCVPLHSVRVMTDEEMEGVSEWDWDIFSIVLRLY